MASTERPAKPQEKKDVLPEASHVELPVLHHPASQSALLEQRELAAHSSKAPDKTAALLPPLAIVSGDYASSREYKPTPSLDATQGWKAYNNLGSDSVSRADDGSLRLDVEKINGQTHETGFVKKLDLPGEANSPTATPDATANHPPGELPVHVRFFAKTTSASAEPEDLNISIIESKTPYAQTMNENVTVGSKYTQYDFDRVAPQTGDGLSLHFKLKGDVEIKNLTVTPESVSALGINPDDLTHAGIERNIEKNRKTGLNITVLDASGKPVPNADVQIKQKTQSFLFGTEVQGLRPGDTSREQAEYQAAIKDNFNFVTITPYFPQTVKAVPSGDGATTKTDYSKFDPQLNWAAAPEQNMAIKLTPVFWPHFTPNFVPKDPQQAGVIANEHTEDFMQHFSKFKNVRVIENNEVVAALNDKSDNGVTRWVQQDAAKHKDNGAHIVEEETTIEKGVLKNSSNNSIQLMYNDYVNNGQEIKMFDKLQKDGKLPDQIGIQMHMTQGEWPLARVEQIINELGKYGKPIFISEISVISGEHRIGQDGKDPSSINWPSTSAGEQRQADYTERLYQLLYSNPNVHGITWWDLSDKNSWQGAPRGLLNADMTHKPVFDRLHQLIRHDWMTDETSKTDYQGEADQRVFQGDYDITASDGKGHRVKKTVHVGSTADGDTDVKIQLP